MAVRTRYCQKPMRWESLGSVHDRVPVRVLAFRAAVKVVVPVSTIDTASVAGPSSAGTTARNATAVRPADTSVSVTVVVVAPVLAMSAQSSASGVQDEGSSSVVIWYW